MIVQTWSGSRIELTRERLCPWLMGWIRAAMHPVETLRIRRRIRKTSGVPQKLHCGGNGAER
jgi:hypothetical protein